jgi:class 3 adenylate cyclase/predicted ATPase
MRDPEAVDVDGAMPSSEAKALVFFAGLILDLDACTLARESGEAVQLTRGEFTLLCFFASHPRRVLTRDMLLDATTGRRFEPFDRSIDVMVGRLRRKIEPDPKAPRLIVTMPGGYQFAAVLRKARPTAAPAPKEAVNGAKLGAPAPLSAPALAHAHSPGPAARSISGERRPVTLMFCDLVGSTGLMATLDPEDWRDLVKAYLGEASKVVTGLGGYVLTRLGNGLMAIFGYPEAQENDAERAVRAALAIQRALAEPNARNEGGRGPKLAARVGLDSGPVVVEPTGEVFGEPPNIAARVLEFAEPGAVVVTANVHRQVAGLFVAEDKGAHELQGVAEPVTLYRVVRASGGRQRAAPRALTSFVGRAEELALLARRWEPARAGEGQFVLIVGEPGIGKSRLVEEFRRKLAGTSHTWVEWGALQLLQNTPLHPIAEWGRIRFGADAPVEQRLADLENTLELIGLDPAEHAPLLAPLVNIPLPAARAANLPPEELRRRQLEALIAWVMAGARSQPVALAFEDLHWADPTSLDLMQALAERGAQAPLLIIATARPAFRPPWSLRSHHGVTALAPLDRADVRQMIGEIASQHALSREVVERVSERTGGVPLFIEEVTRLLLERGEAGGLQAIPPTLQQSLAARLDRLGEAREVAQIGAVLGREFSFALLSRVAGVGDPAPVAAVDDRGRAALSERGLQSALDRLVDADLVLIQGAGAQATYRFKHALIQVAAYESLLKSRRQALHRRAGEILRDSPENAAAEPEAIAHHFTEAGLNDLAIEWWGKAGDQALRRSAFQEAIAHLGRAIAMADSAAGATSQQAAGDTAPSSRRLKLQTDYGQAVMWLKGFAAEETKAAFARAAELAEQGGTGADLYRVYQGQWDASWFHGELILARKLAESFVHEAEAKGHGMEAAVAHRTLGQTCVTQGELALARNHLERALALHDPEKGMDARRAFGTDTRIAATAILGWSAWLLGEIELGRRLIDQVVRDGCASDEAATIAQAYTHLAFLETFRDDPAATQRASETLVGFSRMHDLALYAGFGDILSSWARGRRVDPRAGASELREALEVWLKQGNRIFSPWVHCLIAELEAMAGHVDAALATVDQGLALAEDTGEHWKDPLLFRRKGEILLRRDPANLAPAEEAFQSAIAIAKQQGSRSYGLRAALALAKLCQSTGRPADAHAVLAPALEGFAPTPELPEIAEAQVLLERLT